MELIQTFKKSYFLKMSNDKHLIAQVNSSQINIFENETYKHLAQFKEVGNASVFFSNDSNLLLAKDNDRKLVVYDLATISLIWGMIFHTAIYRFMILKTERKQDFVKI